MSEIVRHSGVTVICLDPSHDSLTEETIRKFGQLLLTQAARAEPPILVVDLAETEYIGSSFLELLLRTWKRLKERKGTLALCRVRPFCLEVLEHTRLDTLWPAYSTRGEAVTALAIPTNGGGEAGAEKQPD